MRIVRRRLAAAAVLAVVASVAAASSEETDAASVALQRAVHAELVDGDLSAAIAQYEAILERYPAEAAVAARTLLHLGQSYERLGDARARAAYQRILDEYSNEVEHAARARTRLATLRSSAAAPKDDRSLRVEVVWPEARGVSPHGGSISPDGTVVSYVDWMDQGNLALRDLASGESRRLTTDADNGSGENGGHYALDSRISPDGARVVYSWARSSVAGETSELRMVSVDGGTVRNLWSPADGRHASVHDWFPTGDAVVALVSDSSGAVRIVVVSTIDGQAQPIRSIVWAGGNPQVRVSPNGRYLAYSHAASREAPESDVFIVAADGSSESVIVEHSANDELLGWSPDGRQLLFRSDRDGKPGLWGQRIADGAGAGEPELLVADLDVGVGLGIARDGTLYYANQVSRRRMRVANLDMRTGELRATPYPATEHFVGLNRSAVFSPDGETLAIISDRDGWSRRAIIMRAVASGEERELPHELRFVFGLWWCPDGERVLVTGSDDGERFGVFEVQVSSGETRMIPDLPGLGALTPDGTRVLHRRQSEGEPEALYVFDLASGTVERLPGTFPGRRFGLSSSGDRIVTVGSRGEDDYRTNREVRVHPATGGDGDLLWTVGAGERLGRWAVWTPDGEAVVVLKQEPAAGEEMWRLWIVPVDGSPPVGTELVYEPANAGAPPVAVHPDGERVVYTEGSYFYQYWAVRNLPLSPAD